MYGGTIVLAESLDDVEAAFQEAVAGRAVDAAVRRHLHPERASTDSLAPAGKHVVSDVHPVGAAHAGPTSRDAAELDAYADRLIARMEAVAPGFTDSICGRQVIGPHADGARSTGWSAATSSTAS